MTTTSGQRLMMARKAAGFSTMAEAVNRFGFTYSTYASHETDLRAMSVASAERYAVAFKTNAGWILTGQGGNTAPSDVMVAEVIGEVAAGVWLEAENLEYRETTAVPASPDPRFPPDIQFALRVRGTSMNKIIDDGAYAIAAQYEQTRSAVDGDIVVVRRTRAGLCETTIKRFRMHSGSPILVPESDDPRYQDPISLGSEEDGTIVEIIGLVIGVYKSLV